MTERAEVPTKRAVNEAPYRCIVADPPWAYDGTVGHKMGRGAAIKHYEDVQTDDLATIVVPAADNAHLYLWVTNTHLLDGEGVQLCRAWGFVPKQLITWVKPSIGLGRYYRNTTEHVIFAVRGRLPVARRDMPTHFLAPRGRHSQKPGALQDIAEQMSPGPRLEMFARNRRDGWDAWGDEVPLTLIGGGPVPFDPYDREHPFKARLEAI